MKKRKLKKALRNAETLRDEWCEEYTRVRDELYTIKSTLKRLLEGGLVGAVVTD